MKIETALGFAAKAGKLLSGDFSVDKAVKSGRVAVVITDTSASPATKKHWQDACAFRNIPYVEIPALGHTIGKNERMVAATADAGFAKLIISAYSSSANGGQEGTDN